MTQTFTTTTIGTYKVTVFFTRNGSQLHITDADGDQIYAHKVSGDAMERAMEIIASL